MSAIVSAMSAIPDKNVRYRVRYLSAITIDIFTQIYSYKGRSYFKLVFMRLFGLQKCGISQK